MHFIDNPYFTLPSVTLTALRNGENEDRAFDVNIHCGGSLDGYTTRGATVQLYSNDIVDEGDHIIRNGLSSSSGIGFQLISDSADPVRFSSAADKASTALWSMSKGSQLQENAAFSLGARYKIYDDSAASAGSVVGRVIAYIDYD